MKTLLEFSIYYLLISLVSCKNIPSSFKKCDRKDANFNQCLKEATEIGLRQLNQPIKELGLNSLEPLEIPSLAIGAGSGPVGFEQNYSNLKVYGYSKSTCSQVEMDFREKTFQMECLAPEIRMEFHYKFNGKIIMMPISGDGPGIIILEKLKFNLLCHLEEFTKNNETHFVIVDSKFKMAPEGIHFDLKNMFNGDEVLTKNINQVMNDNWPQLFTDVQSSYEDVFGQIFASMFNNLLSKLSVSSLFGDE